MRRDDAATESGRERGVLLVLAAGSSPLSIPSSFRTDPERLGDSSTEESGEEGRCCGGGFLGAIILGDAAAGVEVVAASPVCRSGWR